MRMSSSKLVCLVLVNLALSACNAADSELVVNLNVSSNSLLDPFQKIEKVRARNKKGHYVADDKSTPNVNEAWTTKRVKKSAKK